VAPNACVTESACLLVVEDDGPTRTFLADNLTADGYELLVAGGVRDALRLLELHRVDLAVVDVGLPDGSGLDLVRAVRAADGAGARLDPLLPIVLLSGRAGEIERVRGFERGADDFVAKPYSYTELRLRVAALLRRAYERRAGGPLRVGALQIDPAARDVRLRGVPVALSQKEFALLSALAVEPTRVFTKAELLRDVWGFRAMGATRTLDSHAFVKVLDSRRFLLACGSLDEAEPSCRWHGSSPRFLRLVMRNCPLRSRCPREKPSAGRRPRRKKRPVPARESDGVGHSARSLPPCHWRRRAGLRAAR
jgi:DNA-binding response OmpR family regulator